MLMWGRGSLGLVLPLAFHLFAQTAVGSPGKAISFSKVQFGHSTAYVVKANLNSKKINVRLFVANRPLSNPVFPHESFHHMINRTLPTAAINGTYYDTRTYQPVGTLVAEGEMIATGTKGVAVCFDANNRVWFYKIKDWRNFPWYAFKVVLSTGPTLVESGRISLFPRAESFHDPTLFRGASRSALGVTRNSELLLVSVPQHIRLRDMAYIMQKLGAYRAVSLDGGRSTALYYRGDFLVRPGALLTNILAVYEDKGPMGLLEHLSH